MGSYIKPKKRQARLDRRITQYSDMIRLDSHGGKGYTKPGSQSK